MYYPILAPDGSEIFPKNPDGSDSRWQWGLEKVKNESERIDFVKTKEGWSVYFRIYFEDTDGRPPETIWPHGDVGSNRTSKKEIKDLFGSDVFDTPKPEALVSRILDIATNPGDLVLDSFGGSGTTGAVAHKMGRKWIMVELGEHCHTHIIPRMQKVCDGSDQGGISKAVNWQGGGGFKYYYLAPSLLKEDKYGNWIISKEYNPAMLAAALAKQEGFRYQPDEHIYWKQGKSSEKDYIYTTTQFITVEMLDKLHDEMQPDEGLLIACKAYHASCEGRHANISIKKIPQMLLGRCEFGKDDYSLNIVNMPVEENEQEAEPVEVKKKVSPKKKNKEQTELFGKDG